MTDSLAHPRTRDELLAEVERHTWLYTIDLGGGVKTKGLFGPPHTHIREALDTVDVRGKKVLDVGCWEGHWSFEIERRGAAEVYATDYLVGDPRALPNEAGQPELPTFKLAHTILGSKVRYFPTTSVYHIDDLATDFDVIVFCGVYYHLKHPLVAFSKLRRLLRPGGTMIIEGPVILGPTDASARFFYREVLGDDATNWWVPTVPCLRQWIDCSFLERVGEHGPAYAYDRERMLFPTPDRPSAASEPRAETIARCAVVTRAVERQDSKYSLPDEDLHQYCR